MEKKLINKTIILLSQNTPITWESMKDLPFEAGDIIYVDYDEEDSFTYEVRIFRKVLETDEQFAKRTDRVAMYEKIQKAYRLAEYKKLKKEFEP